MEKLWQDLVYGSRMLAKSPGFTLVAVLTLALGIGANTAIFSVVNTVLLKPLPFAEPDRLVMIWGLDAGKDEIDLVSAADFDDWRASSHVFQSMAASRDASYSLTGDGDPESIRGYRFSSDFWQVLDVQPILGRTFLPEEDAPGHDQVVVLSHRLWLRRFGGDPAIVGKSIMLSSRPYTVIGVMPAGFSHPQQTELWTPLALDAGLSSRRDLRFLRVMARLASGATVAQAQTEMDELTRRLGQDHPDTNTGRGAKVVRLHDQHVGDIEPALLALLGAVGFVLLIACANVANLSLVRAVDRRKEIAIRSALGAGRLRLARQVITESVLLSGIGGALGLILAAWSGGLLLALFPNNIANLSIPHVSEIPIDASVLAFTLGISLLTGVTFGLAPALQATRPDLNDVLKDAARGSGGTRDGRRLRGLLVVAEMALAVVLLAGAGLMIRSFIRLQRTDIGLRPDHLLTGQVMLPQARYAEADSRRRFVDSVLERLESLPGAQSAGATNFLPLTGFWGTVSFTVEGLPRPRPGEEPEADNRLASPGYFATMGIRLIRGRGFTKADSETAPRVAIVNQTLASRWWPGADPIGRRIELGGAEQPDWWTIVGVAADVRSFGPDKEAHAEIFRPLSQTTFPLIAFVVRTTAEPAGLTAVLKEAIWQTDRDQPVFKVITMDQLAADSFTLRRISMVLMTSLALLAVGLAAVGVYGVVAYSVSRRTHEIGLRMALGASKGDLVRLIVRQAMTPMAGGAVLGLLAAMALTRFLSSLLYQVEPTDPATFLTVPLLLMAVALAACWLPALRAAKVDPMIALKNE